MVAFLTGTAAFAGTVINMDSYGIVPSKQDDTNCRVIYSWGNSSMHHRFGRFYTMSNNFHLGVKTPYSWSAKAQEKYMTPLGKCAGNQDTGHSTLIRVSE